MADYITELKHALQEAAAREYPDHAAHPRLVRSLRARMRGAAGSQTRTAVARLMLVLPVCVAVAIFVIAIGLLQHGHTPNERRHVAAQHAPRTDHQHAGSIHSAQVAIDSALAHGIDPPAPDQNVPLPILGAAGTRTLKDFRGHVVVLNIFASWCDPCRAETAALERTQKRIERQGGTVIGVAYLDDVAAAERFVHAEHITYPVLRENATLRVARAFGINGVPETFVIDRDGRIVAARRYQVTGRWLTPPLSRARHTGAK
jgi:cytochrome c biogenesis protein CcmG, thiol:disulfide interchange protein DsbE